MSLEQQIAALVDASNNLTTSVDNKIKDIDKKVDDVADSFSEAIRSSIGAVYWVDQQLGSDLNEGSQSKPLKTLKSAQLKMIPGGSYEVRLLGDYALSVGKELMPPANALVWIRGMTDANHLNTPRLTVTYDGSHDGVNPVAGNIDQSYGGSFYITDIILDLNASNLYDQQNVFARQCFIRTNGGTSPNTEFNVQIQNCDLSPFINEAKVLADAGNTPHFHVMEIQENVAGLLLRNVALSDDDVANKQHFVRDRDSKYVSDKYIITNNASVFRDAPTV